MSRNLVMMLGCLVAACGGKQVAQTETPAPPKLEVDGNARLSDDVVPTAYRLDISIDPASSTFEGTAAIDIEVNVETRAIHLHAEDLDISKATLIAGETAIEPALQTGENNGLGLAFADPIAPGTYTLEFAYQAPFDEVPTGLYRVKDGDAWYAFTQFEPLEARQAFPSFDEPKFKTPFTVTMRVPAGQLAFANTPEVGRETVGETDVFEFATSKPLPTYLVAFAVGPLDVLEGPNIGETPFRLIATKGKAELGQYMIEQTPILLEYLTEYFGQPYPYEKLDIVAVPNFAAGAMENVGLVTFRETLLLLDPENASVAQKRSALSVMAHELAHMWFGNLVTLPWWEEIWLNEGFATWMASKTLEDVVPQLESNIDRIGGTGRVMGADSRAQTRPIRLKIEHGGDIYNSFSAIAYGKGAAVLRLFEAWIGPDAMRAGVRDYLAKHEHGTGTTESLLESLGAASDKPVSAAMGTFLDQPGAPLLTFTKQCADGKTTLAVEQSRYLPAGSKAAQTGPWHVPVCVAWPEGSETKSQCFAVQEASSTIELPTAKCPAWYYPNAGQVGYYRWNTEDDNLAALLDSKAFRRWDSATKVELLSNLGALADAEVIGADRYLTVVRRMASEKHRTLVSEAVSALYQVEDVLPDEQRAAFEKAARRLLSPHLKSVGLEPTDGEPPERSLLRPTIVRAAAFLWNDPAVIAWSADVAKRFGAKMDAVADQTVQLALPIAGRNADASLWLSYKLAVDSAPTPAKRVAAIQGLGSFRDPSLLEKSLDLFLTDPIRSQDMWALIGPSFATDETFALTWAWFEANFDAIVEKVGSKAIPRLPSIGSGFCSAEGRARVEQFFADPSRQKEGQEKNLADTLESIDQCMRRRAYLRGGLDAILK